MALFGREAEPETPIRSTTAPSAPRQQPAQRAARKTTLIAAGAHLTGEISGDTDILIEGTVEGRVHPSQDVTVGENGVVRGEIEARRVQVAGKVEGNVLGKESVELLASGSLEGDVSAPSLVIGDGAFFKGRVEMTGTAARGEEPKSAAKSSPSAPGGAPSPSSASPR
jgi:cytoskeletal protein CcmA (bactofilin family)